MIKSGVDKPYKFFHYKYPDEILQKKISSFILEQHGMIGATNLTNICCIEWFNSRPNEESITGDISNASMLDEEFTNINMIKYFKFGFGRATDLVCEMIRDGSITRDKVLRLLSSLMVFVMNLLSNGIVNTLTSLLIIFGKL